MSYGDSGVAVFSWTNPRVRNTSKWVVTPYLANTADTGVTGTYYSETDMQNALGKLQKQAISSKNYDQIVVTRFDETVPSAGDTGIGGDVI